MLYVVIQTRVHDITKIEYLRSTIPSPPRLERMVNAIIAQRVSWILGSGALVATLTQLVTGAVSDRFRSRWGRRRPFIVAGTLLTNLGLLLFVYASTFSKLLVAYLLIQLLLNMANGPYQALLPDLIPIEHHGKASGYMGLWQLLGRTIGMVGGALLLNQEHGLIWMVIAFALLLNGLMLITVMLVKEPPQAQAAADRSALAFFSLPLKEYPDFNWVLISRFIINCGLYTILPFLDFFLIYAYHQSEAMAREQLAIIGLVVNLSGLAAVFPAGAAGDRFSKKRIIYFTCTLSVVAGIAFTLSTSPLIAIITTGLFGIGYGAFSAVDWALVCNVLPTREPAKYMGVWGFSDTLPQIVAPFIGGELAAMVTNQFGADIGYRTVIFSSVIWFILGAFFIRYVRERKVNSGDC